MTKQARSQEWYDTVYFNVKSQLPLMQQRPYDQDFFFGWADWIISTGAETAYDIGGGNGRIGEALALRGWAGSYHLIDWSVLGLQHAQARLQNVPHGFTWKTQQADITQGIPFENTMNVCAVISGVLGWVDHAAVMRHIPSGMRIRCNPANTSTNTVVWRSEEEIRTALGPFIDIESVTAAWSLHERGMSHRMWYVVGTRR